MRAIFFFFILVTFLMTGCASVEIVKGVTKVTQSFETSVKKIFELPDENKTKQKILVEEKEISEVDIEKKKTVLAKKQAISKEQKKISELVIEQKEIATLDLSNKTMKELNQLIGQPNLIRKDGKTTTVRFDSRSCRIFIFMNSSLKTPRVEYYELRNSEGELIDNHKDIESCFNEIKPV